MKPYFESGGVTIYHGDCRDVLPDLHDVGLVVTDPPYVFGIAPEGRIVAEPLTMQEIDRKAFSREDLNDAFAACGKQCPAGGAIFRALRELKCRMTPVAVKQFKALPPNGRTYNGCPLCEQNCPAWYKFCPGCGVPLDWSQNA